MAWTFTIADVQPAAGDGLNVRVSATDGVTTFPVAAMFFFADGTTKAQALAAMQAELSAMAQNAQRCKLAQANFIGSVIGVV